MNTTQENIGIDEDAELDQMTSQLENNQNFEYRTEYYLDHIARLFQGCSKCAAVVLTGLQDDEHLMVSRNDIFEGSKTENAAIAHFNSIKKLLVCFADKESQNEKQLLEISMEYLIKNYETEKHCALNDDKKKAISLAIIKKAQMPNETLILKEDLEEFCTKTQRCEAASLFIAGSEFMRSIKLIKNVLEKGETDSIIEKIKRSFKSKNIQFLKFEKNDVHAEARIISWLFSNNVKKIGYIGISKLPCLCCSSIIELFNLMEYDLETKKNSGHGLYLNGRFLHF